MQCAKLLFLKRVHLLIKISVTVGIGANMQVNKSITFLIACFCFSSLAGTRTDSIILSTKSIISGGIGQTNSVDTGITIENGDLWIWGFRGSGQQGNGQSVVLQWNPPERVNNFVKKGLNVTQVAAGIYHIIALDDKGNVWGWGQNGYQEAAGGLYSGYPNTPVLVLKDKNVVLIEAGEYVSYALTKDGDVYAWGHGIYGQIGNGNKKSVNHVYKIPRSQFDNRPVVLIGGAYEGGYAINDLGGVFAWGDDQNDSFGYARAPKEHVYVTTPIQIYNLGGIDGAQIRHICGGEAFTNFLTSSGDVYGMGRSNMLGIGSDKSHVKDNVTTPVHITSNVTSLYCRYGGSVAITHNAEILTWGFDNNQFDMYGIYPINRTYYGDLIKIDGGKEHILYWNDKGEGYGVGYGAGNKLSQSSNHNVSWPGVKLQFVIDAMKKVYGQDYIPGQGQ